jgi:hypothetical protein
MNQMDYQPLTLRCRCGEPPARIEEIGFSAARELVIHWWCQPCQRLVFSAMPLTDCWNVCPTPRFEEYDRQFLQTLGVTVPE